MSKNIIMQQKTASGYEELYPKTDVGQITGMEEYGWKVGDIRSTVRNDLGEKWLLCNGDAVDDVAYSEITGFLPTYWNKWNSNFQGKLASYNFLKYYNGQWILGGTQNVNGAYLPFIWLADESLQEWTAYQLSQSVGDPQCMTYNGEKGEYAIVTRHQLNTTYKISLFVSSNLTGNWTEVELNNISYCYPTDIIYQNGKYIITTIRMKNDWNSAQIICVIDSENYSQEQFTVTNGWGSGLNSIIYANGIYVIARYAGQGWPCVFSTNNLTGSWTCTYVNGERSGGAFKIFYYNGLYVTAINSGEGYVLTATEPTGTWTSRAACVNAIEYYDGLWVKVYNAQKKIETTTDILSGEWNPWNYATTITTNYTTKSIVCGAGKWFILASPLALLTSLPTLPTITVDSASAYIKVKS